MKREAYRIDEISAINIYDERVTDRRPVIMILHGAGVSAGKESGLEAAEMLASLGYFAVVFDACGYGDSRSAAQDVTTPLGIFANYRATSSYINRLIHHLSEHPQADANKVGLTGFSMGAHVIYYYLAHERINAVKVAVPMSGSPRWDNIARRFATTLELFKHLAQEESIQEFERQVMEYHPIAYLEDMGDFPLFLTTGELDEKALAADVTALYHKLASKYSDPDRIKLTVYKGIGHVRTKQMMRDALAFLMKYLRA